MRRSRVGAIALGAIVSTGVARPLAYAQSPAPSIVIEPKAAVASVSTGGTLSITTSVAASADLPDGTIVSYSASANLFDASFSNSHSVSGSAKVAARKITISLKLPYFWKVVATGENMTVSMRLSANVSAPSGVSRSLSTNFSKTLATPANNATTSIAFSGSL